MRPKRKVGHIFHSQNPTPSPLSSYDEYTSERPWEGSFMSQFVAEAILQVINLELTARITKLAASRGYYKLNFEHNSLPRGAQIMYGGALLYTITLPLFLVIFPFLLIAGLRRSESEHDGYDNGGGVVLGSRVFGTASICVSILAISTWLASWLIWSGYMLLMGDL
jgi:hypothetical protein